MSGERSTKLLGLGLLAAVAVGALAAAVKPSGPPLVSPGNVAVQADEVLDIDPATFQRELLDGLVADSAVSDPTRLPALTTFVSLYAKRPTSNAWILDRLTRDDVPAGLQIAFAQRLPRNQSHQDAAADRLLGGILELGPDGHRRAALNALRARGRVAFATSTPCGCGFGVHPRDPGPGDPILAFVYGATAESGLAWQPRALEDGTGWVLDVHPEAGGSSVLARRLPPAASIRVVAHAPPSEEVTVSVRDSN